MTDNEEQAAQYEQLSLFAEQTPEEQTAAICAEIAKDLAEFEAIRNSPEYKASDLLAKLDEIAILAERCSSPRAIKIVCQSAAKDAAELYEATGNKKFEDIADRLTAVVVTAFFDTMEQAQSMTEADKGTHSIVYTATGKDFVLPAELEAYRADNPLGAELYEQERAQIQEQEPPQADSKYSIRIDLSGYDPKLDPGAPEFDIEAWREAVFAVDENGETMSERTQRRMQESLSGLAKAALEAMPKADEISAALKSIAQSLTETLKANMQDTMQAAYEALAGFSDFLQSETYTAIKESVRQVSTFIEEHSAQLEAVAAAAEETEQLYPFLQLEIDELNAKAAAGAEPVTLDDVLSLMEINGEPITDIDGDPFDNPFIALIERAKKRKADFEAAQELTATVEQLEAELPILQAIVPAKHTMPNNALMNALQKKPAINYGEWDLTVANPKGKRKEITALAKVSYDAAATGIELTGANMTEYERQVSDGIITLWLYGDESHIMTTDMIYRAMTGQGGEGKAPQGQKGAITKFMKKWEGVRITVDATEEMRKRGVTDKNGKPIKQFVFDEYYLNTRRVQVRAGGETVTAWQIISKPVMLTYCEMTNQLLTVPAKMLDIKEVTTGGKTSAISLSNNADRIAIKGNLLRSIQIMKGKKRNKQEWSNIIAFDTLFAEIGLEDATRNRKKEMRNYAFSCFDYWKAEGFIAGYQVRTKGKAITGVEINL